MDPTIINPIIILTIIAVLNFKKRSGKVNKIGRNNSIIPVTNADDKAILLSLVAVLAKYMENASAKELLIERPKIDAIRTEIVPPDAHIPKLTPKTVIVLDTTPKLIPCLNAFESKKLI